MAKDATVWKTDRATDELSNDNEGVTRLTEDGTTRVTENGTTRVLEDTVVTPKSATAWAESNS